MKNLYLFQPQQTYSFDAQISYWLPYSVGCLWSYARQNIEIQNNVKLVDIYFKRGEITSVVDELVDPDVALFSCYVWNWEYNKLLAKNIKDRWPNCIIVFGGPQVTDRPVENRFFKKHPYVDVIVNGEGEEAIEQILLDLIHGRKTKPILSFSRLKELSYPSPYTGGVFDDTIAKHTNNTWQVVLETNRGCPYQCTFCDWGSATYSKVTKFDEQRVIDDITWFSKNKIDFVFIADANFGILHDRDKRIAEHINHLQITTGFPKTVSAQWAKNGKSKILDIAKIFFSNKNRGFSLSVQSMNDTVLDAIKRKNLDISDLEGMLKLCAEHNISTYTEIILSLPYETKDTWRENLNKILSAGQHGSIDVWFLSLIENAELNSIEQRTLHDIKTVKVPKRLTGAAKTDDPVVEYENIAYSTRYMSFDDLITSYMFSHIIVMYHCGGWTQVLARFMNQQHDVSYLEFYDTLEKYIQNHPGTLNKIYYDIREFVTAILTDNGHNIEKYCEKEVHSAVWNGLPSVAGDPESVFSEIFEFFDQNFPYVDNKILKSLKQFQVDFMYDFKKEYPYQVNYAHNIPGYINNQSNLNTPITVEFSYPYSWDTLEQYQSRSFIMRRREAHKALYTK
jgi:putative methyltransferase